MRTILTLLSLAIFISCQTGNKNETLKENWIPLFNGENLDGWDLKIAGYDLNVNFGNTFRVEDGLMKVRYDAYDSFNNRYGHIFYKEKFSHYKLRIVYRFVGEQAPGGPGWAYKNSGVMLHSQSAASMKKDQSFPVSIEAQFLGGSPEGGERPTANLCTPGTHVYMNKVLVTQHCINSSSKTFRGEEWVTVEFVVLGDSIVHHLVEGDTVISYQNPVIDGKDVPEGFPLPDMAPLKEGYICLQSESHPIDFKSVELLIPGK